jgi:hypothetical protein
MVAKVALDLTRRVRTVDLDATPLLGVRLECHPSGPRLDVPTKEL